ncbi:MAG: PAS domain-containing protein [Gemmatimonadaceae bacterium]
MPTPAAPSEDFAASFAQQRQRLLHHAASLISPDGAVKADPEALPKLSQLMLASLEVLKVAEEELVDDRRRTAATSLANARRVAQLEVLFELAPAALILTTADTSIRETNKAAASLLTRDAYKLEGKQLLNMIPRAQQPLFREQLARVIEIGTVAAWSFTIERQADVPILVTAAVEVIVDAGIGARALYWNLRPA